MVNIIAHRGWWETKEEQNTLVAFQRAFDAGIGVELDVRDHAGELVVSHDPPVYKLTEEGTIRPDVIFFHEVLNLLGDRPNILAVNVKSCGLAPWFAKIEKWPKNWFFFDVAPPGYKFYRTAGLPYYVRMSPTETPHPIDLHYSDGVWLDTNDWLPEQGPWKPITITSPELHGVIEYEGMWWRLKKLGIPFSLCTDHPQEALEYFK